MSSTDPLAERHSAAVHEGGHVAAAWALGLHVEFCTVQPEDGYWGRTRFHVSSDVASLVVKLAGYLAEGVAPIAWPPDWSDAQECDLEGLGRLIREAPIPEETYRSAVALALRMVDDPEWQRHVSVIARALGRVGNLDADDVSALLAA